MRRTPGLVASILAAERSGRWAERRPGSLATDPFRLDLPAPPGADEDRIDGPTMEALGGLYLMAMLEQTGLLRAAELLADHRAGLRLRSVEAAEELEALASDDGWLDQDARGEIFWRVFGLRTGAGTDPAGGNTTFANLLLAVCSAVELASSPVGPPGYRQAAVVQAVRRLRSNLALRQYGSTLYAARRIAEQIRDAVALLQHPGIIALVGGTDLWDVVHALWQSEPPDIDRLVEMGQAGQQIIGWAGSPDGLAGRPGSAVTDAAAEWLADAGFERAEAA